MFCFIAKLFEFEFEHYCIFRPVTHNQGSHGREKGRELFFPFPTLKRSGRMIFFNKVGKWSGKMKSANDNFPKVQITRKFGIDLLQ